MLISAIETILIIVYFRMFYWDMGRIPVPACLRNNKMTIKNNPFMMRMQAKLIYQPSFIKNIGDPLPE